MKKDHGRASANSKKVFLKQFLARPHEVASIAPSSTELVEKLISGFPHGSIRVAVEYGPGTGAITEKILRLLPENASYIAAEPNAAFREHLHHVHPEIEIIPDYAQNIAQQVLTEHGPVDFIVSGLPCSIIPLTVLEQIFIGTHTMLRDGGEFRMFIYTHTMLLPKMHKMLSILSGKFRLVQKSFVWRNIPPAMIIRCVK